MLMTEEKVKLSIKGRKPNIFVVEDDALSAELIGLLLERFGANSRIFSEPFDFLRELESPVLQPDLFIIDVMLPGMTGIEVLKRIRQMREYQHIPVVLLTSIDDFHFKQAGFDAGADDYLNKPFNSIELGLRLRALLRIKEYHENLEEIESVFRTLVAIVEAKDIYTKGHSLRVAQLAEAMGKELRLPAEDTNLLYRAGLLHDAGKIIIDSHILNKPGPLNQDEWAELRRHPQVGAQFLTQLERTSRLVPLVRDHHEKLNGEGYPSGKDYRQIDFYTRILSVADVFDALTSARPYRDSLSVKDALTVIEREVARGWWDPEAVHLLKKVVLTGEELAG